MGKYVIFGPTLNIIILTIEQRIRLYHSILFRIWWQSIWLTLRFGTNFVMQWRKTPRLNMAVFLSTLVFHLRKIWKIYTCSLSFALKLVCFDGRYKLKGNANSCILLNTIWYCSSTNIQDKSFNVIRNVRTQRGVDIWCLIRSISLITRKKVAIFRFKFCC